MRRPLSHGFSLAIALLLIVLGTVQLDAAPTVQEDNETLTALIAANESLSTLSQVLVATGLDATLAQEGLFTLFAPSDAAFAALGDDVPTDTAMLTDLLLYHVVPGEVDVASGSASTALGDVLEIGGTAEAPTVNGIAVTEIVTASNGVLYLLDSVLAVPAIEDADGAATDAAPADDDGATVAEGDDAASDADTEASDDSDADAETGTADAEVATEGGEPEAADEGVSSDEATGSDGAETTADSEADDTDAGESEEVADDAGAADDGAADAGAADDGAADDGAADAGAADAGAADAGAADAGAADDGAADDGAADDGAADAAATAVVAASTAIQVDATIAERSDRPRSQYKKVWNNVNSSRSRRR